MLRRCRAGRLECRARERKCPRIVRSLHRKCGLRVDRASKIVGDAASDTLHIPSVRFMIVQSVIDHSKIKKYCQAFSVASIYSLLAPFASSIPCLRVSPSNICTDEEEATMANGRVKPGDLLAASTGVLISIDPSNIARCQRGFSLCSWQAGCMLSAAALTPGGAWAESRIGSHR